MEKEEFSKELREQRERLGYTRKLMAEKMGMPYGTLEQWESQRALPPELFGRLVLKEMRSMESE